MASSKKGKKTAEKRIGWKQREFEKGLEQRERQSERERERKRMRESGLNGVICLTTGKVS